MTVATTNDGVSFGAAAHEEPVPESRRAARRAVNLSCELIASRSDDPSPSRCADLSPFGMSVDTDHHLDDQELVVVSFHPPTSCRQLTLFAEVKRGIFDIDSGTFTAGLEFVGVTAIERQMLSGALRGLPPRLPARFQRTAQSAAG